MSCLLLQHPYLFPVADNAGKEGLVDDSIIPLLLHLQTKQSPRLHLWGLVVGIHLKEHIEGILNKAYTQGVYIWPDTWIMDKSYL